MALSPGTRLGPFEITAQIGVGGILVLAVASALTAATILAAIPVLFGSPQAQIHIQWRDVNEVERVTLEQQFGLTESTRLTQDTWSYVPTDISAERLGAIVRHPAVVDTSGIDRFFLRISDTPPLTPRRGGLLEAPRMARSAKLLGYLLASLAAVLFGWATLVSPPVQRRIVAAGGLRLALKRGVGPAITRGIPELRAEVLGFFRFFYAAFLFLALADNRSRLAPGSVADAWPDWRWVAWLAGRTDVMAVLEYGLFALLVLFAIGLFTRIAYRLIAAGMMTCVLVSIQSHQSTVHVWIVAAFTILCLIPAPWHATPLSVDDAIRRWRGRASARGLRGKSYGYAVWMPGFILGTVWASAAYSKMEGGLEWVLGGAVKYHWVIDAAKGAPVDWGLWVASHHWASVLMSFSGVFLEAVFVLSVFARPGRWRNVLALTGLPVLVGFHLFHNVLWWSWWLVYLSFAIPWTGLYDLLASTVRGWFQVASTSATAPSPGLRHDLRPVHMVLIALVFVHATLVLPAGFGRFASYSNTYPSTAAFDAANVIDPIDRLWIGYGTAQPTEVATVRFAANAILGLANDEPVPPALADWIRTEEVIQRFISLWRLPGESPKHLTLTRQRQVFDWTQGRFQTPDPAEVVGSIDLDSMTVVKEE